MAQETIVKDKNCLIPTFERNRYFFGKAMTVRDFDAEQQYLIGKSRLLNQLIHGAGIICGMQLNNARVADGKFTVEVSEGLALDCCGNLIVSNKTDRVEVQGVITDGKNYLYVRFSECVRQPIMASANVSNCEEVCCYNRIRETFEIFTEPVPPAAAVSTFTGAVKRDALHGIVGAKVEALQKGIVQAETLTDNDGNFSLAVRSDGVAGVFDLRASATGFNSALKATQTIISGSPKPVGDFVLTARLGVNPNEICNEATQNYFEGQSTTCAHCDDPKVFLGVANISGETVTMNPDPNEIRSLRSVVYTNPMLRDLLCDHVSDFNNPHRTSAEQVRALQSINGVGNVTGKPYLSNVNLVSRDSTLNVTADPDNDNQKVDLKLANDAVRRNHLNNDTINGLLTSDATVTIQPDTANKRIALKTNPAALVTSVAAVKLVGGAPRFAPEDHVHDLADAVVTKSKLADEVITTLLTSENGTITIRPDAGAKRINIITTPATDVSSVGPLKIPGTSLSFARQDHVHNLSINDRAPSSDGVFRLTPGENITIQGRADNELVISGAASRALQANTGLVRFDRVRPTEVRPSPPVSSGFENNLFTVVLGLEDANGKISIGFLPELDKTFPPLLLAFYLKSAGDGNFVVEVRDTRPVGATEVPGTETTYLVRWWAIPSIPPTKELPPLVVPPKPPQ